MQARAMFTIVVLIAGLALDGSLALPSVKKTSTHIIKTRSIDLNNAHGLAMETRLEKIVEPTGYKLKLEPYLDDGIFKGTVRINITWLKEADEIYIHCGHEVEISGSVAAAVFPGDSKEHKIKIKEVQMDIKKPIATIYLEKNVPKSSTGYLEFKFNGNLETSSTEAFFKTTYKTDQEVERIVAATQLRPNNARRMFPCFDEPEYKAPFELSVVRPRTMVALSNVAVAKTEDIPDEPDAVWDHFERTPPMSTFTLGLVIADLTAMDNFTRYKDVFGNEIELRVWGRPEYLSALEGANGKLSPTFAALAEIWQVPLPLKKLDVVALPNFQGVKPADNWGLIIFKESDLSNAGYYQLAREISYQWLGAFTTPAWWSDAHLNKALVGYISSETSIKLQMRNDPEFDVEWPLTMLYSMYYEFSRRYPHSRITGMKQETTSMKIELMFRMFNNTLGAATFKKALKMLLETHKYKTFTGEDVWKALNTAAIQDNRISKDVDLKTVADSWIDKDRLPSVSVVRNYETNTMVLSQKVFLRERPHDVPDADRMTWSVPIVLLTEDHLDFTNTTPVVWMDSKQMTMKQSPAKDKFVLVNPEEIAPFLVNYDTHNWELLAKYLDSDKGTNIPELTRAKLIHDAWNLAYAGELSFATAFNMSLFVRNEKQHLVWYPVFTMIDHVGRHICQCVQEQFRTYVRSLLTPLYEELTKDIRGDDEGWRKNLRAHTRSVLCTAGYTPCVVDAQENYAQWMQLKNPDEGNPISDKHFCPVFNYGTKKEWEFGLQRVLNFPPSRARSERTYLLKTLAGCPRDEAKINRLLNVTILEGNGNFTENDLFLIFNMLTGSPEGYTTLFKFLSNNWDFLKEKFGHKTNLWDSLVTCAASHFTTQEGLEMVTNLYMAHQGEFASSEHIVDKSIRNIREEVKWSNDNTPVIREWLRWYLSNAYRTDIKFDE